MPALTQPRMPPPSMMSATCAESPGVRSPGMDFSAWSGGKDGFMFYVRVLANAAVSPFVAGAALAWHVFCAALFDCRRRRRSRLDSDFRSGRSAPWSSWPLGVGVIHPMLTSGSAPSQRRAMLRTSTRPKPEASDAPCRDVCHADRALLVAGCY